MERCALSDVQCGSGACAFEIFEFFQFFFDNLLKDVAGQLEMIVVI
jgi:hypothetical protein